MKRAVIKQTDPETPTEVIATALTELAAGMKQFRRGRLSEKALVILLHHSSGVSMANIKLVLASIAELEKTWLR